MTDAEKQSFKHNALLGMVERLNSVNASNWDTLTTNHASGTTIELSTGSRLRRNNVVNFVALFSKNIVTISQAVAAVATLTPANPLVISYTKADSSIWEATATSGSASGGTAAPTPSLLDTGSGAGGGGGEGDGRSTVTVLWVTILCVVVVAAIVYVDPVALFVFSSHSPFYTFSILAFFFSIRLIGVILPLLACVRAQSR
jgi:hypothetical protein